MTTKPEPNWTSRWLKRARITNDPVGDLIGDMRTDPDIPRLFPNLKSMRDYVSIKSKGDRLIMAAVPGAWMDGCIGRDFSRDA